MMKIQPWHGLIRPCVRFGFGRECARLINSFSILDELKKPMFSEYQYLTKEWAANPMGVPQHAGAATYYKKAGLLK